MNRKIDLSIVVPCYNEERNIPLLAQRFGKIPSDQLSIELILVNNGSTDNSDIVIKQMIENDNRISTVIIDRNIGYGNGINTGLLAAHGSYLCWTHADMQTDIYDVVRGYEIILKEKYPEKCFVKGKRQNRSLFDTFFSVGMALFESVLLCQRFSDINAQPNIFHRNLLTHLNNPPDDFSFDLYVYYTMRTLKISVIRFPVHFGDRAFGSSHWNTNLSNKVRFIRRTVNFSMKLRKRI